MHHALDPEVVHRLHPVLLPPLGVFTNLALFRPCKIVEDTSEDADVVLLLWGPLCVLTVVE